MMADQTTGKMYLEVVYNSFFTMNMLQENWPTLPNLTIFVSWSTNPKVSLQKPTFESHAVQ